MVTDVLIVTRPLPVLALDTIEAFAEPGRPRVDAVAGEVDAAGWSYEQLVLAMVGPCLILTSWSGDGPGHWRLLDRLLASAEAVPEKQPLVRAIAVTKCAAENPVDSMPAVAEAVRRDSDGLLEGFCALGFLLADAIGWVRHESLTAVFDRVRVATAEQLCAENPGDEADAAVLRELRSRVDDLSQPRRVRFFFVFGAEEDARAAVDAVVAVGYTAGMEVSDGQTWLVTAETHARVNEAFASAQRRAFEALALRHHGEFVGWEADADGSAVSD